MRHSRSCLSIAQGADRQSGERGNGGEACTGEDGIAARADRSQILAVLSRKAFVMTETELRLIAAAAIMGLSSNPVNGYKAPAAIGTPRAL